MDLGGPAMEQERARVAIPEVRWRALLAEGDVEQIWGHWSRMAEELPCARVEERSGLPPGRSFRGRGRLAPVRRMRLEAKNTSTEGALAT